MTIARARWRVRALIAIWALTAGVLWWATVEYEFATPTGYEIEFASSWPNDTSLVALDNRPALLLFIHPLCPCTRATLYELERLLTTLDGDEDSQPRIEIVAAVPGDAGDGWLNTPNMELARRLPGARIYLDIGGRETAIFGASTSGTAMMFDASGDCRFAGGLTSSRGHEGASAGTESLAALFAGREPTRRILPVFGCRLCLPQDEARHADASRLPPAKGQNFGG